jgi:hypothetical protein
MPRPLAADSAIHPSFPAYTRHDPLVPVRVLTPGRSGCFHRFFDTSPISPSGRYCAVLRLAQEHRLNEPGEEAEVVLIDLATGTDQVVARTRGWEPQLGANLNWGVDDHCLVFNDVDTGDWSSRLVRLDPLRGTREVTAGGVYHVSPDGCWAAASSLEKMRRTQIGYGVVIPDELVGVNRGARDDDGLFITELASGRRTLVLSLAQAVKAIPELIGDDLDDWHIYGFHCKWSPDGERLIFTVRRIRAAAAAPWDVIGRRELRFDVLTCRPDGSELRNAVPAVCWAHGGHHINWFPDSRSLSMNLGGFGDGLRFVQVDIDGGRLRPLLPHLRGSGHPSVHPSGHLLTDSYTHEKPLARDDGTTPLRWISLKDGREREAVRMTSAMANLAHGALRVDPHPAWDRNWRRVVFNAVENGTRRAYLADFSDLITP